MKSMTSRSISLQTSQIVVDGLFEAVTLKARIQRTPRNGKPHFTMMSLHYQNAFAKERSKVLNIVFAVGTTMWQEKADMVAEDFNGASWRHKSELHSSSTVQSRRRSRTPSSQCHGVRHPDRRSREVPGQWSNDRGFVRPPQSQTKWPVEVNRQEFGLSLSPMEKTCHHDVWIHLSHASARLVDRARESTFQKRDVSRKPTRKSRSWNPLETMCCSSS